MSHDVFISHSSTDKAVADAACAVLESRGIRCWIAPRDISPGSNYAQAITDAVHASSVFVLVFSAASNSSPQVRREVDRAVSLGQPILPVRVEDVTPSDHMEYYLAGQHWLDALTPPLEEHLQRLADAGAAFVTSGEPAGGFATSLDWAWGAEGMPFVPLE